VEIENLRVELPDKLAPVCLFRVSALRFLIVVIRPARLVPPRSRTPSSSGTRLLQDARLGLVGGVHGGGFSLPGAGCGALDLVLLLLLVVVRRRRRSIEGVQGVVRRVLLLLVVVVRRRRRLVVERMTGMQRGCVALLGVTVRVRVRRVALHGSISCSRSCVLVGSDRSSSSWQAAPDQPRSRLGLVAACLRTTAAVVAAQSRALGSAGESS
jgi:hypothetical protein